MYNPALLLPYLNNISPDQQLWLAYSGGLDSHVLLHSLYYLIKNQYTHIKLEQVHAIYINHGWSQQAEQWAEHCKKICSDLNIALQTRAINAKPPTGQSPEAYARAARYNAFAELLNTNDYLFTGHHQDDQAETLLTQLARGAGVKGLASMPVKTSFGKGWHLRPLLHVSRSDLLAYAKQAELIWIEDESNTDTKYTRNFLRHAVIPILQQRWPTITTTIARTATHCAETAILLNELAAEDLLTTAGNISNTLSCQQLRKLSEARQKNVLRYWLEKNNIELPSTIQLNQLIKDFLYSKLDATPEICWQAVAIRRYQDNLYIINKSLHNADAIYQWNLAKPLIIPNIGTITAKLAQQPGINSKKIQPEQLTIRFRQHGERCQPAGRQGSHPLKKLFQEWHIPPWQRESIPLLYHGDEIVAVIGYCICEPFNNNQSDLNWIININT